jgi:hypothetical protein
VSALSVFLYLAFLVSDNLLYGAQSRKKQTRFIECLLMWKTVSMNLLETCVFLHLITPKINWLPPETFLFWVHADFSVCYKTEHHAMKLCWRIGGVAPRILDLGTRWKWVVSFAARPLYTRGKSPWYPLDRSLGGPQSRSGRGGEEKNSHSRHSNPRSSSP